MKRRRHFRSELKVSVDAGLKKLKVILVCSQKDERESEFQSLEVIGINELANASKVSINAESPISLIAGL